MLFFVICFANALFMKLSVFPLSDVERGWGSYMFGLVKTVVTVPRQRFRLYQFQMIVVGYPTCYLILFHVNVHHTCRSNGQTGDIFQQLLDFSFDIGHTKIHWCRSGCMKVAGSPSYLPN